MVRVIGGSNGSDSHTQFTLLKGELGWWFSQFLSNRTTGKVVTP